MHGCEYYDYYGDMGGIYGSETLIDRPIGNAALDYQKWLIENPQISEKIHDTIMTNIENSNKMSREEIVARS